MRKRRTNFIVIEILERQLEKSKEKGEALNI